ncbi:MAG: zinc transporter ZupT [Pseudomonadota bacterium]
MESAAVTALALTTLAGLATGLGGVAALFIRRDQHAFLAVSLGLSAGVMLYIAFVELYADAVDFIGGEQGKWIAATAFLLGMMATAVIDGLVPEGENPHQARSLESVRDEPRLLRLGALAALAITLHNFPEGVATFMAALSDPVVGSSVALAVALHNIPEGIAVAIPLFYATARRGRPVGLAFLSGLAEPLGALAAFLLLRPFLDDSVMGIVFAAVAGIMVFISLDQLVPNAKLYGRGHQSVYGLMAGMAIMAVLLNLAG